MLRILFLCVANSARSQMAEGIGRKLFGEQVDVVSAGSSPKQVSSHAIKVMSEIGIDISMYQSKSVSSINPATVNMIVTLCAEEVCFIYPDTIERLHWPIADPAATFGNQSPEAIRMRFRASRDQIMTRLKVLHGLLLLPGLLRAKEFHGSIYVNNRPGCVRFFLSILSTWPKVWTQHYATFFRTDLKLNFSSLTADCKTLPQDRLCYLDAGVPERQSVVDIYRRAIAFGAQIEKHPRAVWKKTPIYERWVKDPYATQIEYYAQLMDTALAGKSFNELPVFLTLGTSPGAV